MGLNAVSYQSWDTRAKKIQNRNLKLYGRSLTWVSMLYYLGKAIKVIYEDDKIVMVDEEEYKKIRKELLTGITPGSTEDPPKPKCYGKHGTGKIPCITCTLEDSCYKNTVEAA